MQSEGMTVVTTAFLSFVALLFPDLQLFNLVDDIVAGNRISPELFGKTAALGVVYFCVYTLVAYIVFSRKEL
jgi:ABC-2 type transport system permease protein